MTLTGRARFRILGEAASMWETGTGDIVLLAADGWPAAGGRCLVHGVEPPPNGERVIMTHRHNVAGAAYFRKASGSAAGQQVYGDHTFG